MAWLRLFGLWLVMLVPAQILLNAVGLGMMYPVELSRVRSVDLYLAANLGGALGSPQTWLLAILLALVVRWLYRVSTRESREGQRNR